MPGGQIYYEVTSSKVIQGTENIMCEHGAINVETGACTNQPRKHT